MLGEEYWLNEDIVQLTETGQEEGGTSNLAIVLKILRYEMPRRSTEIP